MENFISTKIKAKIVEHEFFRSDFSSEMLAIAFHLMPSFLPYSQIRILANQNTIEAEIDIGDSINNFSSTKPILLDLSNFNSMGSLYADIFNRFFSKYEYIVILMNTNAIETFKGMGFEGEFFVERESIGPIKKIL